MELIKETLNISEMICGGNMQIMADGDIIVPEIKPDMLKILQVDAISCILDAQAEDGRVNISGQLCVTVLYVPDCEGEKIRSIEMKLPFEKKLENAGIEHGMNVVINSNVERLEFSAQNSRKLRIKAIISAEYEVVRINEVEIACGVESESAQIRTNTVNISNFCAMEAYKFNIDDSIEIPNGRQINETLKTDVKILDTEYKTVDGKIVIKGSAAVCVLYTDDECNIAFTETEIPFTEVVDADGITENSVCDIDYSILYMDTDVCEDNDGDRRIISITAGVCAQIKAFDSIETEIISDCYEPFMNTELTKMVLPTETVIKRISYQNTLREVIDFENDAPEVKGVYNVVARPVITKTELRLQKLVCEGNLETYILYLSDDADNPIYSVKKNIPFSYVIDCEMQNATAQAAIKAEIKHIGYSLNVAGELELRCIIAITGQLVKNEVIEIIDEACESKGEKKSGIVIYFVQSGDDLWKIAKRYAVPCEEIMKYNHLEDENVKTGMNLFIPICK